MDFEYYLNNLLKLSRERKQKISKMRSDGAYYKNEITKNINENLKKYFKSEDSTAAISQVITEVPNYVEDIVESVKIADIRALESIKTIEMVIAEFRKYKIKYEESKPAKEENNINSKDKDKKDKPKSIRNTKSIKRKVRDIGQKPVDRIAARKNKNTD